jgi:predicted HTH transcriptional regulator
MLKTQHISLPANPLLARPMYLYGSIEQLGTGTEMIVEKCLEIGLPVPDFEQSEFFKLTLWRNVEEEKSAENIEKSREKIINLMKNNVFITQNGIVELTGLSIKSMEKNISILKKEGLVRREVPNKGGYWQVI